MVTINQIPRANDLPVYLGLGRLEPDTIRTTNDCLTASYFQESDLIYRVQLKPRQTLLEEFYQKQVISQTIGGSLQETFIKHFSSLETYQDLRLRDVFQPLMTQGNIYLNFPPRFSLIFYPAGLILGLRIPLDLGRSKEWFRTKPKLDAKKDLLKLESEELGFLFYLTEAGEVKGDQVFVLEFSAMLLNIKDAAQLLIKTGLIGKTKERRMVITGSTQIGEDAFSIYLGDRSRGILTYTFLATPTKTKPESIAKQFFDDSIQFLEMLNK